MHRSDSYQTSFNRLRQGLLPALAAVSLAACGGGGEGGGSADSGVLRGTFVDSPVAGLEYFTASRSGITDADGVFRYLAGETVTFRIGELIIGSAPGAAQVTPLDIANSVSLDDDRVTNILRLLQSLDEDADATNGIALRAEADNLGAGVDLDDAQSVADALAGLAGGISLVDLTEAVEHFEGTLSGLPSRAGGGLYTDSSIGHFPGSQASACPTWNDASLEVVALEGGGYGYSGSLSRGDGGVESFDLVGTATRASGSTDGLTPLNINVDPLAGEIRVDAGGLADSCLAVLNLTTNDSVNLAPVAYRNSPITQGICQSSGLTWFLSWSMHAADKDGYLARHPNFRYTISGQTEVVLSVGANDFGVEHYGARVPKRTDTVEIPSIPCTAGVSWEYEVEDNEGEIVTVSGSFEAPFDPEPVGGGSFQFCAQNYPVQACDLLNDADITATVRSGSCTSLGFDAGDWEDFGELVSGLATGTCVIEVTGTGDLPSLGLTDGGIDGGGTGGDSGSGIGDFTYCAQSYPGQACAEIPGADFRSSGPTCTSLGYLDDLSWDDFGYTGADAGTCLL